MINAKGLTKVFGTLKALDEVDIEIKDGIVFGLVGSNGSGKSTLLRLISGVYTPDGGELLVDNEQVLDNIPLKNKVFFLSDNPYFIHQSNLNEMAAFYNKVYDNFDIGKFSYLLTIFPINPSMKIQLMSKGMQRQAALILALSASPQYLLLDEAFDGLDPVIRGALKKILADGIAQRGMTVIISSHNLRELEDLCDHVGLLHQGKLIFSDDLDNLKTRLHKVQIAFAMVPDTSVFEGLDVVKIEKQGSLMHLVIRGEKQEILDKLQLLNPILLETLSPTLEELFIYEMEVAGYDIHSVIL